MSDHPHVANPEAIGDPDQTPVLVIPQGPAGDFLRQAVANNTRIWLREKCGSCGKRREDGHIDDHTFGELADHEFVEKPFEDKLADRKADHAAGDL